MPFTNLAQQTHDSLTRRAVAVKSAKPLEVHTMTFRTSGIPLRAEPASIAERLQHWTKLGSRWIYVFDTAATQAERKALVESFSQARDAKTAYRQYRRERNFHSGIFVGPVRALRVVVGQVATKDSLEMLSAQ